MIVYFTGTGNSRYCAQMLATALDDELFNVFRFIRNGSAAALHSEHPWVFVAPTYGWQLPRIFADFLRSSSFTGCKAVYFVMTCGSEIGNAGVKIKQLCAEKGLEYRGVLQAIMPENYVAMFAVPGAAEAAKIVEAARPCLETAICKIRAGEPLPDEKSGVPDKLKTAVLNPLFYRFFITAKHFYATDACIACGKCEQNCPLNNIRLENGKPVWAANCTHCMACICACPEEAIEYGRRSKGKPRYQCCEFTGE